MTEPEPEPEPVDHGKGIDDFYRRKREDGQRDHAKMMQMINDGYPRSEIQKQEQRWLEVSDCGD